MRTGAAINLQDLRTRIYEMAKSNRKKRFWGLYCHVCNMEILKEAYVKSKRNNGSAGIDGITFRQIENGKRLIQIKPPKDKVKKYMARIKEVLAEYHNQKVQFMIKRLNMIIRGWVNHFRIGHCSKLFDKLKQWTERKVRRFQRRKQKKFGYGWKEWSSSDIYEKWGLYNDYAVRYHTVKA